MSVKPIDFDILSPKLKQVGRAINRTITQQCAITNGWAGLPTALVACAGLYGEMVMRSHTNDNARQATLIRSNNSKKNIEQFYASITTFGKTRLGLYQKSMPSFVEAYRRAACASLHNPFEALSVPEIDKPKAEPALFIALARPVLHQLNKHYNLSETEAALACAWATWQTLIPNLTIMRPEHALTLAIEGACIGAHRHPLTFGEIWKSTAAEHRPILKALRKETILRGYRKTRPMTLA